MAKSRVWLHLLFWCVAALALFSYNLQHPQTVNFDEAHYIPAARQILAHIGNVNTEHPPLAKYIIASGVKIFGDNPFGWRIMSVLFGAITIGGVFMLGLWWLESLEAAWWITFVSMANNLIFVQARIAMLDTFMMAFLIWGLAFFVRAWRMSDPRVNASGEDAHRTRQNFYIAFALFGVATGCKWFGLMVWLGCLAIIALIKMMQAWGFEQRADCAASPANAWYTPTSWQHIRTRDLWIGAGVLPFACYALSFLPLLTAHDIHLTLPRFFRMQYDMWDAQQRVVGDHPYISSWMQWVTLKRPIWYAYATDPADPQITRGVLLIGNPIIMWGGLLALVACAWRWVRNFSWHAFVVLALYGVMLGSWFVIPRKVTFYYYYYPAGIILSYALAACAFWPVSERREPLMRVVRWFAAAVIVACFIYFLPILAALPIKTGTFTKWMWVRSWI